MHTHAAHTRVPRTPIRFALYVSRPYWAWGVLTIFFMVIAVSVDTATYYVYQQLIDTAHALSSGLATHRQFFWWVVALPVTLIGHQLLYRASGASALTWTSAMRSHASTILFEHLSLHSIPYFSNRMSGSTANKIWNASGGARDLVDAVVWNFINTALAFVASAGLLYTASPVLTGLFAVWMVVLVITNYQLSKYTSVYAKEREELRSRLSGYVVDIVSNMFSVINFANRKKEVAFVAEQSELLRIATWKNGFYSELLLLLNNILLGFFTLSMVAAGYYLWDQGHLTIGQFIMSITVINGILGWFSYIGMNINHFAESYGTTKEGLDQILEAHTVVDAPGAKALVGGGDIVLSDVTFAYGNKNVFEHFNLTFKEGERVGLVGPSGSGKTTLVSILLRQYDIQGGAITLGGQNIAEVTQDSLREHIAVVPQDPALFHRTIRENIAYGKPDATHEEVVEAAKKAEAHEFISALEKGYDTEVGERGVKLSGGQRQRIAIARAILKAAPILILDEATSSLDSESEAEIQKALHTLMQGKTVIAIAHRLSTIKEMDRIIVMEGGTIVEDGTHDVLVTKEGGCYARLWAHQAGGFIEE
ncbi:ABC transporter ATP-binding protein/permease [Patescibacteria group bacterium]|nr:ABC transporter ATP-binding protein/permease [Patescibacteria group bacterium]